MLLPLLLALAQSDGPLVESMDEVRLRLPKEKARADVVEGKAGKAVKFSFDDGCVSQFCMTPIRGTAEWDRAAGISFWVKGDGSKRFGGLQLIWNEDYAARYDAMFPLDSTEWRKVVLAWRDFVPVLPSPNSKPLDPAAGSAPSKVSALWFGKWFYWRDFGAHAYAVDEVRLEPRIDLAPTPPAPSGPPLARVAAKLKAKQPLTIVTMGDSLTDFAHWANKPVNWPTLLAKMLKDKHGVEARLVNPAIGGTQLRQGAVLIPRWAAEVPEPDLVTVLYGYNDWDAGMRGPMFRETAADVVDRIRRATKGKSDVLLVTTCPALERWSSMGELAEAIRAAAADRKAGLADTEKAFHAVGEPKRASLFCSDKTHLGPDGHVAVAAAILAAIEAAAR